MKEELLTESDPAEQVRVGGLFELLTSDACHECNTLQTSASRSLIPEAIYGQSPFWVLFCVSFVSTCDVSWFAREIKKKSSRSILIICVALTRLVEQHQEFYPVSLMLHERKGGADHPGSTLIALARSPS